MELAYPNLALRPGYVIVLTHHLRHGYINVTILYIISSTFALMSQAFTISFIRAQMQILISALTHGIYYYMGLLNVML
jgi:hydrogenase maturation factor HypE